MSKPAKSIFTVVLQMTMLLSTPTAANTESTEYMAMITDYVQRLSNIYDGTWAYTYTVDDRRRDEVRVRRVDPAQPEHRMRDQLLSVNGAPPTEKRLSQHNRQLDKRERRRIREGTRAHEDPKRPLERPGLERERFLAALIPESIELVKQEGDLLHIGFRAMEEGRENVFDHLQGLLILDTANEYIKELQLRPDGSFYPFFMTKVEEAFLSVRFELVDGTPIQTAATWQLLGQALIVKNLDADMEVEWMDFEKVTPALAQAPRASGGDADDDDEG
jgi:hypothetical protein